MSKTNLQIAKPAAVTQNASKTNAGISYSPKNSELPVDKIQLKSDDSFGWMSENTCIKNRISSNDPRPGKQTIIQPQLEISRPDDEYEREAGSIADKVMRMPDSSVEDDKNIQAKPIAETISPLIQSSGNGASENSLSGSDIESRINNPSNSGSPLPENSRTFMESSFGTDFSHVKIHTDSNAEQMNKELNAQAFTHGSDIYFNSGKFNPESSSGKHLLAHELTHVVQQQGHQFSVQRETSAEEKELMEKAELLEAEILADPAYSLLKSQSKRRVKTIIKKAKKKPLGEKTGQRNYYLIKLKTAITTPFKGQDTGNEEYGCSQEADKENREEVEKFLIKEIDWNNLGFENVEEEIVAGGKRKVMREGQDGKIFYVDRSDAKNIRVLIKVKLKGNPDDIAKIKALEDAIEREASTTGYTLDIAFVDKSGFDVFEFSVNFCEWANSGNWASGPVSLSHEVHHALGLDDRYDYIESHAGNQMMNVPMRLVWFEVQMDKAMTARDDYSKMSYSGNQMLSEDVCSVAFGSKANRDRCVEARKELDPSGIPLN
ncbi:MAG TPA: DUF4157 domain-containing protein [Bacteroidales bacterium]|nr:DUF4157 domain-containing protein [Bacteroidales bacterium]